MKQKNLSGRLARWSMKLQGIKFDIQHRSGSQNVVADTLSRTYEEKVAEFDDQGPIIYLTSTCFKAPEYLALIAYIKENQARLPDLKLMDDYMYKRTQFATGTE